MAWIEQARNRYRVRFRHTGMIYTDSTFTDRAKAEERLNTLGEGIRRRAALFEPGPAPLLKQWVPIWMNSRLVGEAAGARDECLLRVHILPRFGNTRMSAIDMLAAQLFAKQLRRRLARSSVITILALLRTVLRDAVRQRLLLVDPLAHVEVPAEAAAERPVLTQDQVWALACRMPTQRLKTMIVTAAGTGMRFGELAALAPAAISLDTYRLHIDPDVGSLHEVAGKRWLGPPKPPSGARKIYLPTCLVEAQICGSRAASITAYLMPTFASPGSLVSSWVARSRSRG